MAEDGKTMTQVGTNGTYIDTDHEEESLSSAHLCNNTMQFAMFSNELTKSCA